MLFIVIDAPNEEGWLEGKPLAGASLRLLRQCLSHSGINLDDAIFRTVFPDPIRDVKTLCGKASEGIRNFPPLTKGKYLKAEHAKLINDLHEAILHHKPNLVITLGSTAMWAVTGISNLKNYRGTPMHGYGALAQIKVIPTFLPGTLFKDWSIRPVFLADLEKARRNIDFPEIRKTRRAIHIEPTFADLLTFEQDHIRPNPQLSIDIETSGRIITCVGLAPTSQVALVVPFVTANNKPYWPSIQQEIGVWKWVKRMCALDKTSVFQNGMYDMQHLWRNYGIPVLSAANGDDTMLLHHALQPEMEKSLRFLGSIYTDEVAWKFMGRKKVETMKAED
jgi:uracil-DNA glycosylase